MVAPGEKYRSRAAIAVSVWWELDTAAILGDYSEWCEAELPAGEVFTILHVQNAVRHSVICELAREAELKNQMIPRKRQNRLFIIPLPTPYVIEMRLADLVAHCDRLNSPTDRHRSA